MHALDAVFWTCLLLGGGYTLVTLVLGAGHIHGGDQTGDFGHADTGDLGHVDTGGFGHVDAGMRGNADAGHVGHIDTGDFGHVEAGDTGHAGPGAAHAHDASTGESGGDTDHAPIRVHMLSYLNPMAVAGFFLGFGGIGVMTRSQGAGVFAALAGALLGGYALWLGAYLLVTRVFAAAGGTSHFRQVELVGVAATVTAPIAPGSPGMICCTVAGSRQAFRAILDYGESRVPTGATVRVRRLERGTAHVVPEDDAMEASHVGL